MTYKIKKGKHYSNFILPKIYWNKTSLKYIITFTDSCKYNFKDNDQLDINKLFGLGYFSWDLAPHHIDSVRFGWRWNNSSNNIDIFSYCYVNKNLSKEFICSCDLNKQYIFRIIVNKDDSIYNLYVKGQLEYNSVSISYNHNKKLSYFLKPYFGGNKTAPHKIIIDFKRI